MQHNVNVNKLTETITQVDTLSGDEAWEHADNRTSKHTFASTLTLDSRLEI